MEWNGMGFSSIPGGNGVGFYSIPCYIIREWSKISSIPVWNGIPGAP